MNRHLFILFLIYIFPFASPMSLAAQSNPPADNDSVRIQKLIREVHQLKADKRYAEALEKAAVAKKEIEATIGSPSKELGEVWFQEGILYYYSSAYEPCETAWREALSIWLKVFGEKHQYIADCYLNLANVLQAKGEFGEAIQSGEKALEIQLELFGEAHSDVVWSYSNLSFMAGLNNEFEKALRYSDKAIELAARLHGKNHSEVADAYQNRAAIFMRMGELAKARELMEVTMKIRADNEEIDQPAYAIALAGFAATHFAKGDFEAAIEDAQKATDLLNKIHGEVHSDVATSYTQLAAYFQHNLEYDRARDCYEKALDIYLNLFSENYYQVGNCYNNLGGLYMDSFEPERALLYFEQALDIFRNLDRKEETLMVQYNRSILWQIVGKPQKGRDTLQKVLRVRLEDLKGGNPTKTQMKNIVDTYNVMGLFALLEGKYDEGLSYLEEAAQLLENNDLEFDLLYRIVYGNTAYGYFMSDDLEKGNYYLDRSLKFGNNTPINTLPYTSNAHIAKSLAYSRMKDFKQAESILGQVLEKLDYDGLNRLEQVTSIPILIEVLKGKAKIQLQKYEHSPELSHLERARVLYSNIFEVMDYQFKRQPPSSKAFYAAYVDSTYFDAVDLHYRMARLEQSEEARRRLLRDAFSLSERTKGFQLLDAIKKGNVLKELPQDLSDRERNLRIEIARYEKRKRALSDSERLNPEERKEITRNLFRLNKELEALHEEIRNRFERIYQARYDLSTIDVQTIQEKILEADQTLVEYLLGDEKLYIFVIRKDAFEVVPVEVERDSITTWVKIFTRSAIPGYWAKKITDRTDEIRGRTYRQYEAIGYKLYEKLWLPIESKLGTSVVVIPSDELGYLPFEALLTKLPQKKEFGFFSHYTYLLRKHQISYCYSATLLWEMIGKQPNPKANRKILAMAPYYETGVKIGRRQSSRDAVLGHSLDSLKTLVNSGKEVEEIVGFWGRGIFLQGRDASLEQFDRLAGQYGIIHLSTHGISNNQFGEFSFLALSTEQDSASYKALYAKDIYNYSLQADMVVLSACETTLGELQRGEGVISLARAFSYAGAESLVTSLWTVDDAKTRELMVLFYRHLKEGKTKDAALRQAKLDYLEKMAYSYDASSLTHPFFWAGFIAIGDMRNLTP